MTDRNQARAMDLPGYSCPPFVRDIPTHAGTWGWIHAFSIVQDDHGYLWADGQVKPKSSLSGDNGGHRALVAWSEAGLSVWVDPDGYGSLQRLEGEVDTGRWVPVAALMAEAPGYAGADR